MALWLVWLVWAEAFVLFLVQHNLLTRQARDIAEDWAEDWLDRTAHGLACLIVLDAARLQPARPRQPGKPRRESAAGLRSARSRSS